MAGDWLKWEKGLASKKEVIAIASMLNIKPAFAAGLCMTFWEWLDDNVSSADINENGDALVTLGALQASFVDSLLCADGFAAAMTAVGWLIVRNGSLVVPNYARHNGQTSKERALHAKRQERYRNAKSDADGDESVTARASPEKRRTEKNRIEKKKDTPPLPPAAGAADGANAPPEEKSEKNLYPGDFLKFWDAYPKKESKGRALKAWKAVKSPKPALTVMLEALAWQRESEQWRKEGGQFIPHPASWLNNRGWENEKRAGGDWPKRPSAGDKERHYAPIPAIDYK